jgi:hypothetical protein
MTTGSSPVASADRWGLLRGGEGLMTGTVVSAAVLAAASGHVDSTAQLSVAIVGTNLVYWLAHLHASTIGAAVNERLHPLHALRVAIRHTWTIAAASLLPLAVLLLAEAVGAELALAAWVALWATVALLTLYSYLAGRRGGLGTRDSLVCAVAGCGLGLVAAALKAALH